jgi:uroporphyrin-3 C-methyltransferase
MSETQSTPQIQGAAQPPDRAPHRKWRATLALLLALASLAGLGWQGWDNRNRMNELRQELARRLAASDAAGREARAAAAQAQEAVRQTDARLGLLEARVAEFQGQQVALEALYQELSRNRDETALAEVEHYLLTASQQLALGGNLRGALMALQSADARLAGLNRPQLLSLRKAIAKDMDRLAALPHVDIIGMSLRLDNLIAAVDSLPLAAEVRPAESAPAPPAAEGSPWRRWWRETWEDIKQLVRIRRVDRPEPPLLSPEQTWFLRENLRLRLLSARLALLSRDQASFRADLTASQEWITRYFDVNARPASAALSSLRQLTASEIVIELPDVSASLEAARAIKLPPAKGAR